MARALDQHQLRELAGFVNDLADLGGYQTSAEWARDSGFPAPNLSNLRNARAGVDGYNLLRLLRAVAARLDRVAEEVATAAATGGAPSPETAQLLEELAGRVDALHGMLEQERRPAAFLGYVNSRVATALQQPHAQRRQEIEELRQLSQTLAGLADELDRPEDLRAERPGAGGTES